jgi:zinc protease
MVGDTSLAEAVAAVERTFGHWSDGTEGAASAPPISQGPAITTLYLLDKPGAAQSVIRAAHSTVARSDPAYYRLALLNFAFGGQFSARLNMNLRQERALAAPLRIDWKRKIPCLIASQERDRRDRESVIGPSEFEDIHSVVR